MYVGDWKSEVILICVLQTYLKEILRDIGNYNVKGTHKNTWELRPEYRHYQAEEEKIEERL